MSAAEQYAAAQSRAAHPLTQEFAARLSFEMDEFQVQACHSLEEGHGVLVAAPTGAGKTVVGEFAIYLAMRTGTDKAFYTTPMKALSNQKFRELVDVYGAGEVGLLTGDTNINPHARVVVMTTEVLRNMLYADSAALRGLRFVVMDEVHYLADRFRGAVWEEVIIHLPEEVRVVALSATVSNAEEFGDWLAAVRGGTEVIVSEIRPVPLEQHVLARGDLLPLFDERSGIATQQVNRELARLRTFKGVAWENNSRTAHARGRGKQKPKYQKPSMAGRGNRLDRAEAIETLRRDNLLPAIFFIFSRVGCEQAVQQVARDGISLTSADERREIRRHVEERIYMLPDEDLSVLGYWTWRENLERGIAAHHAGMLPAFKEIVEELFQRKLVKVVFATETLALGINMPARTVVLEKLEKFNGEARVPITSGEYTQLTGRAGRRGIDVEGHSVVVWNEGMDVEAVAALASRRTYPMNSSFRPTYNMAVNLIDQFGRSRAREILESSFAQFQADRAVVGLAVKVRDADESLRGYRDSLACDRGDFLDYSRLRRELTEAERRGRGELYGSQERAEKRRNDINSLRARMQKHACHSCPDREKHARWAERYWKLERQVSQWRSQIDRRTGTVARIFDRVVDVLDELGYVDVAPNGSATLTPSGRTMRRIYGDRDLLVAESLRTGIWKNLDAASLAALACALVYEPRRDENGTGMRDLPKGAFRIALDETAMLWARLDDVEHDFDLPGTEPLAPGLSAAMHSWARGANLDRVLTQADMAAGDFVRWTKQTIDLLDQLSIVADGDIGTTARRALDLVRRGIVVYSGV